MKEGDGPLDFSLEPTCVCYVGDLGALTYFTELTLTPYDDCAHVTGDQRVVFGGDGNDLLVASNGDASILYGGPGNDTLGSYQGGSFAIGGAGSDVIAGKGNGVRLFGHELGNGGGELDHDHLYLQGTFGEVVGGDGDDFIRTKGFQNLISGYSGADSICVEDPSGTSTIKSSVMPDGDEGDRCALIAPQAGPLNCQKMEVCYWCYENDPYKPPQDGIACDKPVSGSGLEYRPVGPEDGAFTDGGAGFEAGDGAAPKKPKLNKCLLKGNKKCKKKKKKKKKKQKKQKKKQKAKSS